MQTEEINQIVQEIMTDMAYRDKARRPNPEASARPDLEDIFEELIHEDDETSQRVMRRIWKQLR